ncbi:MAG: fimbrillin family protein [Prevotella sp.]|nr:fimbrillin family protein [Prevotella sp.]
MKLYHTITILSLSLLLLVSCNEADELSGDDVPGYSPVMVSAAPLSPFTRGYVANGMYDNFKVFAASEKDGARTVAMDGYVVNFVADDWSYVNDTQHLVYWNPNADSYLFTAGAPIDAVTSINASSMTLSMKNNTTESVMVAEPLKIMNGSDDFGKRVNLRFAYAHCRVCVAFKKKGTEDMTISDIKLTPDAEIASEATLTYFYAWSTDTPTATSQVSVSKTSKTDFAFAEVTIPADNTTDAVLSETHYYCVPDASNPKGWQVSLKCNGETKQASFVNRETWQSGKNYIYVFSISEKGPKLIKVISQDMYFDCNDIVSGGEFSNKDMTE